VATRDRQRVRNLGGRGRGEEGNRWRLTRARASASAGLRRGDIITEINGEAAADPNQLTAVTLTEKPGDTVTITYERDGKSATAKVTLGSAP
jgi:putative serine protease PepD